MDARPEPTTDADLIDQLRVLKARGLTFGQVVHVYAEDNTPRQRKLVEKARDFYEREGELEFDDNVVASGSSDRGDYVMAWRWVYDDETTVTWRAAVTPETWVDGQAVGVYTPDECEWDASEFVRANWKDYFEELTMDEARRQRRGDRELPAPAGRVMGEELKPRSVKVDDPLWNAAKAAAKTLDTDVSKEVRRGLRMLVARAARTAKPDTEETQP